MRFVLRIIFENQFVSLLSYDRSSPRDHWRVQRAKDTPTLRRMDWTRSGDSREPLVMGLPAK